MYQVQCISHPMCRLRYQLHQILFQDTIINLRGSLQQVTCSKLLQLSTSALLTAVATCWHSNPSSPDAMSVGGVEQWLALFILNVAAWWWDEVSARNPKWKRDLLNLNTRKLQHENWGIPGHTQWISNWARCHACAWKFIISYLNSFSTKIKRTKKEERTVCVGDENAVVCEI